MENISNENGNIGIQSKRGVYAELSRDLCNLKLLVLFTAIIKDHWQCQLIDQLVKSNKTFLFCLN